MTKCIDPALANLALPPLHIEKMALNAKDVASLFGDAALILKVFDTDDNGLVDRLELFSTLILVSETMETREKLEAIFSLFDFEHKLALSFEEFVILLRCLTTGLAKLDPRLAFPEEELKTLIKCAFDKADRSYDDEISKVEFVNFMLSEETAQRLVHLKTWK